MTTELYLTPSIAGDQRHPCSASNGNVHLVVWEEGYESWGGNSLIRGIIVRSDGTVGVPFIICDASDRQERPRVATDGTNFLVIWQDFRNGSVYQIWGAPVSSVGVVGTPVAIYATATNQTYPDLCYDGGLSGSGKYVVVYTDYYIPERGNLKAIRVNASGVNEGLAPILIDGSTSSLANTGQLSDIQNLRTPEYAAVACYNGQGIVNYKYKDNTVRSHHYYRKITTSPSLATSGSATLFPASAVYANSTPFGNGTVAAVLLPDGNCMLANWGSCAKSEVSYYVAATPFVISNAVPAPVGIRSAADGGYLEGGAVAWDGSKFVFVWGAFDSRFGAPPKTYAIKGASCTTDGIVDAYDIVALQTTYRGIPSLSFDSANGLITYERDTAYGLRLLFFLFDKTGKPNNVTLEMNDPAAPNTLTAPSLTAPSDGISGQGLSVLATWTDPNTNELGYVVRIKPAGGSYSYSGIINGTSVDLSSIVVLSMGISYSWGVKAVGDGVNYLDSAFTTDYSFSVHSIPRPAAPTNLHVVGAPVVTLTVPLNIQEALPLGITGIDRINEPVTVGIPLAMGNGFKNTSKFTLSNAIAGQFRALGYWPNGDIRYLLVDTLATVPANTVLSSTNPAAVVLQNAGSGNFGGTNMATDDGSVVTVDTGVAVFTLKRVNFNVFDTVTVGGQSLVVTGNAGGVVCHDGNSNVYSSANDTAVFTLEDNGPVRVCLKVMGTCRDGSGNRWLDYTLRLHFYRGKSYVKAFVMMRNANNSYRNHRWFNNFEVVVPVTLGENKTAEYSRMSDTVQIPLAVSDRSYMVQGHSTASKVLYDTENTQWDPPLYSGGTFPPSTAVGLDIRNNASILNAMGTSSDYSRGFAGVQDTTGKGIALAYRWLPHYWPGGFEIKGDGATSIELYSKNCQYVNSHGVVHPFKLRYCHYHMRELAWSFYTDGRSKDSLAYQLQYPLIARYDFSYCKQAKAVFGQAELVGSDEQESFFVAQGKSYQPHSPSLANVAFPRTPSGEVGAIYRWYNTGSPANNQIDHSAGSLYDWLRTGNPCYWLDGESRALFNAVVHVPHADTSNDFNSKSSSITDEVSGMSGVNGPNYFEGTTAVEHDHVMCMPMYYYMTGNEAVREAFEDYGRWLYIQESSITSATNYYRMWLRKFRNIAILYQFGCERNNPNNSYKTYVQGCIDRALNDFLNEDGVMSHSDPGRSSRRGYDYRDITINGSIRSIHSLFHVEIAFETWHQVRRMLTELGESYRDNDIRDYLLGCAHFLLDEYICSDPNSDSGHENVKYGWIYDYQLDTAQTDPDQNSLFIYDTSRAAVFLYKYTGLAKYLSDASHLDAATQICAIMSFSGDKQSPSELQAQELMWSLANLASIPYWRELVLDNSLPIVSDGVTPINLTWTPPIGALQYWIKWANLPIVEWLGFDKVGRTYSYDPHSYKPFYMATDLAAQPIAGSNSISVTLPAGTYYFSARYLR